MLGPEANHDNLENDRRPDRPHPCRNRCRHVAEHWLDPYVGGTGFPRPRAHLRVWHPLVRRWACHCARSQSLDERMAGACDRPWLAVRPGWPCPNAFSRPDMLRGPKGESGGTKSGTVFGPHAISETQLSSRRGNDGISRHRIHRRSRHPAELVEMVRIGCEVVITGQSYSKSEAVVEAEKAIDRALA